MATQNVLVTGPYGEAGEAILNHLLDKEQYEFTFLNRSDHPDYETHVADIADYEAIRPAFDGQDAVIHLAAQSDAGAEFEEVVEPNVIGTYNVLKAMEDAGVETLIFASSQRVMPADESKLYEHFEEAGLDIEPDVAYEDGDLLEGDIRVIQVPGHTEATSALLLEERGVLISGDALDGSDRGGMPPGYLLPPPALFNIDHEAAELNLYDLLGYDFDTVLVFHGSHVFENPKQKLDDFLVEREWNEWDPRTDDE